MILYEDPAASAFVSVLSVRSVVDLSRKLDIRPGQQRNSIN